MLLLVLSSRTVGLLILLMLRCWLVGDVAAGCESGIDISALGGGESAASVVSECRRRHRCLNAWKDASWGGGGLLGWAAEVGLRR